MEAPEFDVAWPTLGFLWSAWITRHCRVPDRHERGKPFREYDWQAWCTANHGRVRPDAVHDPDRPLLNQAFVYRGAAFTGAARDLRVESLGDNFYLAAGDVNGDSNPDFAILIQSSTGPDSSWFVL